MENRITVSICGTEYTLMAEESPAYMQKVAAMVDTKMSEIMAGGRMSTPLMWVTCLRCWPL